MADESPKANRKPPFPAWLDPFVKVGGIVAAFGGLYVVALLYWGIHPKAMDIGYEPVQPVPYCSMASFAALTTRGSDVRPR